MAATMQEAMLEQERDEAIRQLGYATTAIRNAIAEIEEGDTDAAIETLRQIVGAPAGDDN